MDKITKTTNQVKSTLNSEIRYMNEKYYVAENSESRISIGNLVRSFNISIENKNKIKKPKTSIREFRKGSDKELDIPCFGC